MAQIIIDIEQDEADFLLKLIAHRHEIRVAIWELQTLRWKHIESLEDAEQQIQHIIEDLPQLTND